MTIETANKLLKLRKQHNLSQEELAEKLGISRQAVSKWERAEASPDTDNLILLARLYNVSLDELLNVDIKLYNKDTIPLSKHKDEPTQDSNTSDTTCNEFNPNSYIVNTIQSTYEYQSETPTVEASTVDNSTGFNQRTVGFLDTIANSLETFMYKHNISYRWLYIFPYYAVAIGLFFVFGWLLGFSLSWGWFLTIPLYYTTIACIQKRNLNIFCYPVVALIMFLTQGYLFGYDVSWIWFLTIPLYYTIIPAVKKNNPLIFCYPVVAVMLFLIFGYLLSYKLSLVFFATIPFYYWYFSKRV